MLDDAAIASSPGRMSMIFICWTRIVLKSAGSLNLNTAPHETA